MWMLFYSSAQRFHCPRSTRAVFVDTDALYQEAALTLDEKAAGEHLYTKAKNCLDVLAIALRGRV